MATYRDFDLRLIAHPVTGDLVTRTDVSAVLQSIKNLVTLAAEDVKMNPQMYGVVGTALFDLKDGLVIYNLKNGIERTIKQYEPRAEIKSINVRDGNDPHSIAIELVFYLLNEEYPYTELIHIKRLR